MQQIKLRRLAASHQACFYGAKSPAKPVPRLIDVPFERQLSRQINQSLRGEVFAALNAVGAETKLPLESRSLFLQHLFSTLLPLIEGRVRDNQMPSASQTSQRFLESAAVVHGVVERRVEDHDIELRGHEWQAIHFGLEAQKCRSKLEVRPGPAEPVSVIDQQVDSHRTVATFRQPIRQPPIARADIENVATPKIGTFDVRQQPLLHETKCTSPNMPLPRVATSKILERKSQIIVGATGTSALFCTHRLVVVDK